MNSGEVVKRTGIYAIFAGVGTVAASLALMPNHTSVEINTARTDYIEYGEKGFPDLAAEARKRYIRYIGENEHAQDVLQRGILVGMIGTLLVAVSPSRKDMSKSQGSGDSKTQLRP